MTKLDFGEDMGEARTAGATRAEMKVVLEKCIVERGLWSVDMSRDDI
jgi:hypothetical protein